MDLFFFLKKKKIRFTNMLEPCPFCKLTNIPHSLALTIFQKSGCAYTDERPFWHVFYDGNRSTQSFWLVNFHSAMLSLSRHRRWVYK